MWSEGTSEEKGPKARERLVQGKIAAARVFPSSQRLFCPRGRKNKEPLCGRSNERGGQKPKSVDSCGGGGTGTACFLCFVFYPPSPLESAQTKRQAHKKIRGGGRRRQRSNNDRTRKYQLLTHSPPELTRPRNVLNAMPCGRAPTTRRKSSTGTVLCGLNDRLLGAMVKKRTVLSA